MRSGVDLRWSGDPVKDRLAHLNLKAEDQVALLVCEMDVADGRTDHTLGLAPPPPCNHCNAYPMP